ncbi:MAG: hypothetical protein RLZZ53_1216 [Acidobacteriota bacterium]|jgi:hypothetical protein
MAVIPRWTVNLAVGVVGSVVVAKLARPVIVEVVRAGYKAGSMVSSTWEFAKQEARKVQQDASAPRDPKVDPAVAELQSQVDSLKTQLDAAKSASVAKKS